MSLFQRNVEEMRIRAAINPDMSVQIMTLPETVCCMRRCTGFTIQEKYDAMYDFFHECVENGHVHVRSESAPENAVRFPSCQVLSILGYGDYNRVDEAWLRLGREAKERGLVPAAWPRTLAIVARYTGQEIDPGKYCSRIVMPVAEK